MDDINCQPVRPCPCGHKCPPQPLDAVNKLGTACYYRCEECGHVWTVLRSDPMGPIHHVTPLPEKRE